MVKVDITSNLDQPLRVVIDQNGSCDPKAFARKLDAMTRK
jgi:hypothetical protein